MTDVAQEKARQIDAQLLGPGGPFALAEETVLGERMTVFANRPGSLRAYVEQSVTFGDAEYLVFGDRHITFAEHARAVASVAKVFHERYGIGKGDRVAILAANCPEWIVTFWATVSLGAIAVAINGWWMGAEIRYALEDSDPKLLVADRKRLERLGGQDPGMPVIEIESQFEALWGHDPGASLPAVAIAEDDPATILYTSGTTGRSKGAVQSHRNVIACVMVTCCNGMRTMMLEPPSGPPLPPCQFVTSPLFHVSGLHTSAILYLATGIRSVWNVGRFDPVEAMRIIEREKVTGWGVMATLVWRIINHPDFGKYDLSSLRTIGNGGGPTPPELLRRMQRDLRCALPAIGYGLTESSALATIINGSDWLAHPASVGRPLPTVELEIRDPEGCVLPEGSEGEIYIRSPLVMLEYWRRPEATAETIVAGRWLRTGDIGRMEDGRLYLASRRRDLIIRGGENVYPVEIENRLAEHPDVQEAAVIPVPHPELGQEVKAVVVPRQGATLDPAALAAFVGETLARFKVPSHWEIRRTPLPRNATGKVLKQVLMGEDNNQFVED
ncbi:MAG: acyl-CoA synthetase (AMP-forming)/AMP-acid ligase [Deltaproteobacteria bacterium]|nr:acyl-CoA synthetase (AMP-forming)/AMP-acid ligase [Deltaproteobacteria bacterium]